MSPPLSISQRLFYSQHLTHPVQFYDEVTHYCRGQGESLADVLSKQNGEEMPYKTEPQGEAVAFAGDRNGGYYTLSESRGASRTPLFYYPRL